MPPRRRGRFAVAAACLFSPRCRSHIFAAATAASAVTLPIFHSHFVIFTPPLFLPYSILSFC